MNSQQSTNSQPVTGWIGEYRLLGDFTVSAGANCLWATAERDGQQYFVKRFLRPRYPLDSSPGKSAGKARRRQEFADFEQYQQAKLDAIRQVAGAGGRLVVPVAQFRHETFWYTISPWIEHDHRLPLEQIAARSLDSRLLIMVTVVQALRALHAAGIVHGDLKPGNILISPAVSDDLHAFLIDFDSSYFDGRPPPPGLVMGDPPYYSPELLDYVQGRVAPTAVTSKSDVFALGLVYGQYLTGELVGTPDRDMYPAEAVRAGRSLSIGSDSLDPRLEVLLWEMLRQEAQLRPTARHVHDRLREIMWDRDGAPPGVPARQQGRDPFDLRITAPFEVPPASTVPVMPPSPRSPAPPPPRRLPPRTSYPSPPPPSPPATSSPTTAYRASAAPPWSMSGVVPVDPGASAALWTGLVGLFCCPVVGFIALYLGVSSLRRLQRNHGEMRGHGRAVAGLVLGGIATAGLVVTLVVRLLTQAGQ
jgi:hypothetical protein